jgi:hypothetical protein
MNHVEFLGFIVTPAGIVMDPVRVKAIEEWPELESYRDIQVFLGFVNFYRRFIWNFSQLACMLNVHMSQALWPPPKQEGRGSKAKSKKGPTKWYKP